MDAIYYAGGDNDDFDVTCMVCGAEVCAVADNFDSGGGDIASEPDVYY